MIRDLVSNQVYHFVLRYQHMWYILFWFCAIGCDLLSLSYQVRYANMQLCNGYNIYNDEQNNVSIMHFLQTCLR